jgi:hypothetical protein
MVSTIAVSSVAADGGVDLALLHHSTTLVAAPLQRFRERLAARLTFWIGFCLFPLA